MRQVAEAKPELSQVTFIDGDMEQFPQINFPIDTIVSSYVFHHLNETEKQRVIKRYKALLSEGGKVIIGDTMFLSPEHKKHPKTGNQSQSLTISSGSATRILPIDTRY